MYHEEITTKSGHDVEIEVEERHPNYHLEIDDEGAPQCHWEQDFNIDPNKRSPGDTEVIANSLLRLGRRWAITYCP